MRDDRTNQFPSTAFSRRALLTGVAVAAGSLALSGVGAPAAFAADTKPYIPSNLTYPAGDPLAGFYQKLATGTATIIHNGDSITEAYGATTPQQGYPARLRARLRNGAGQAVGGPDYLAARYQFKSMATPAATTTYFTYYDSSGAAVNLYTAPYAPYRSTRYGTGRRAVQLTSTAVTALSFQQKFTSFKIAWRAFDAAGASITVKIGGAAPIAVAADAANERTWTSPTYASATRTVTITFAGGQPYIEGVEVYDGDEAGGIHVIESGQSGSLTAGFSSASTALGVTGSSVWADGLVRYNPDLITSMWGTNEYGQNFAPADLKQHTQNYLNLMHARCPNAALLVIMPYQPGTASSSGWANYRTAQQQAVTDFQTASPSAKVSYLDLGVYIPPYFGKTTATGNPYMSDGVHPKDAGYDVIAAILYEYLTATPA